MDLYADSTYCWNYCQPNDSGDGRTLSNRQTLFEFRFAFYHNPMRMNLKPIFKYSHKSIWATDEYPKNQPYFLFLTCLAPWASGLSILVPSPEKPQSRLHTKITQIEPRPPHCPNWIILVTYSTWSLKCVFRIRLNSITHSNTSNSLIEPNSSKMFMFCCRRPRHLLWWKLWI